MTQYAEGHVKHNPETKEVAVRTIFPEDQGPQLANMAWLVATVNSGARTSPTSGVEDWPDLYDPEVGIVAPEAPAPTVEETTSEPGDDADPEA